MNTLNELLEERLDPGLGEWNILLSYRGSVAHGMHNPDPESIDDVDLLGIVVPPADCYLGLSDYGSRGTKEIANGRWDVVLYEARKALDMLITGNPNIIPVLWLNDDMYLNVTNAGQMILNRREMFVGKHIYRPFVGIAYGQLRRMTTLGEKTGRYATGYMGQKRKQIFFKYGYDTKNAAHLLRYLRMGIEFLSMGYPIVDRRLAGDADELLGVKNGEWTLAQVESEATRLFAKCEEAYAESKLPDGPDRKAINELCVDVVSEALGLATYR